MSLQLLILLAGDGVSLRPFNGKVDAQFTAANAVFASGSRLEAACSASSSQRCC
jgi:hypothetical protein